MNKKQFIFELEKILKKLKFNIIYIINETKDINNPIYVTKEYDYFAFNVNLQMINEEKLDIFLYHEIYHIKQYINNFPMLILTKANEKYSIVQKVITDLYVTKKLIEDDLYYKARELFEYRINNAYKNIGNLDDIEDIFRIAYILSEAQIFFNDEETLELKEKWLKDIVREIYDIFIECYNSNNIENLYICLIKKIDSNTTISLFDNNILII